MDATFAPGVSLLENEGAYAVMAAANELEKNTGRDVVHLEIGQPGFPTPQHVADAGIAAIRAGQTKYSAPAGIPLLRQQIAKTVSEQRGVHILPEEVVVGPGAKPGLFFATLALIRGPQDEVIIPDPGFPTYQAMVNVARGTAVPVRLRKDMTSFDMAAFKNAVSDSTRLVVLNSPGNPTGGVSTRLNALLSTTLSHPYFCTDLSSFTCVGNDHLVVDVALAAGCSERRP